MRRRVFFVGLAIAAMLAGRPGFAEDAKRLAIQGYDPVAYFTLGKPVEGDPGITFAFDGSTYRFSVPEHQELFAADPDRYAPVFRGYCTSALSRGFLATADPRHWVIHGGRLHIFAGKSRSYPKDPDGVVARAHEQWESKGLADGERPGN